MTVFLAALLVGLNPDPVEMPRAEAYLVRDGSRQFLEDRYNRLDLWQSHVVDGCWYDDDGRYLMSATLREASPSVGTDDMLTRERYAATTVVPEKDDDRAIVRALARLTAEEISPDFRKIRQLPRGAKAVRFYSTTNGNEIISAFLSERKSCWQVVVLNLVDGDDCADWETRLVEEMIEPMLDEKPSGKSDKRKIAAMTERELLRADARHSVAAYPRWRVTDSEEFSILDDLVTSRDFLVQVSNELYESRLRFSHAVPSTLDASNVLAVARIFANRKEYADACGEDMLWTSAYWNPLRRELVAYLPEDGGAELIRTLRHEAFHQYLSYAVSMLETSPWFNEGYAQYFEDVEPTKVELPGDVQIHAGNIVPLLSMGYGEFYGGTDEERHYKYMLARSLAFFIEQGAPKVFKRPFANLKRDYIQTLLETKDAAYATSAAFGSKDNLDLFISEWTKFYR